MEFFRPTYVDPAPGVEDTHMSFSFDSGETALPVGVHQSKLIDHDGQEWPVTVTVREDGTYEIRSDPYTG